MKRRTKNIIAGLLIIAVVIYWQFGLLQYGRGYTASAEAKAIYAAEQKGTALEYLEDKVSAHFDIVSYKVNESGKILTIKINNEGDKATGTKTGNNAFTRYIYRYGALFLATTSKLKYVEWQTVGGSSPGIRTCTQKTYSHLSHVYSHDYIKKYGHSAEGLQELIEKANAQHKIK